MKALHVPPVCSAGGRSELIPPTCRILSFSFNCICSHSDGPTDGYSVILSPELLQTQWNEVGAGI